MLTVRRHRLILMPCGQLVDRPSERAQRAPPHAQGAPDHGAPRADVDDASAAAAALDGHVPRRLARAQHGPEADRKIASRSVASASATVLLPFGPNRTPVVRPRPARRTPRRRPEDRTTPRLYYRPRHVIASPPSRGSSARRLPPRRCSRGGDGDRPALARKATRRADPPAPPVTTTTFLSVRGGSEVASARVRGGGSGRRRPSQRLPRPDSPRSALEAATRRSGIGDSSRGVEAMRTDEGVNGRRGVERGREVTVDRETRRIPWETRAAPGRDEIVPPGGASWGRAGELAWQILSWV